MNQEKLAKEYDDRYNYYLIEFIDNVIEQKYLGYRLYRCDLTFDDIYMEDTICYMYEYNRTNVEEFIKCTYEDDNCSFTVKQVLSPKDLDEHWREKILFNNNLFISVYQYATEIEKIEQEAVQFLGGRDVKGQLYLF